MIVLICGFATVFIFGTNFLVAITSMGSTFCFKKKVLKVKKVHIKCVCINKIGSLSIKYNWKGYSTFCTLINNADVYFIWFSKIYSNVRFWIYELKQKVFFICFLSLSVFYFNDILILIENGKILVTFFLNALQCY